MPEPDAGAMADETSLNQQIVDAVAQSASLVGSGALGRAGAEQLTILMLTLAMQNAVAQQQQLYMLQNAATTALVKGLLEGGPDGASRWGEALQLVREAFSAADIARTLARLKEMLDQLTAREAPAREAPTAVPAPMPAPTPPPGPAEPR
jgi:hypothetical protein